MNHIRIILTLCLMMLALASTKAEANYNMPRFRSYSRAARASARAAAARAAAERKAAARAAAVRAAVKAAGKSTYNQQQILATCQGCNGRGKITYWNAYTRQNQTTRCNQCNGTGKVRISY